MVGKRGEGNICPILQSFLGKLGLGRTTFRKVTKKILGLGLDKPEKWGIIRKEKARRLLLGITTLLIVFGLYLVTALDFYKKNDVGMALAFVAYALANVGFMISLWSKK
jgi:hypothetical protein